MFGYEPPKRDLWQGRIDTPLESSFFQRVALFDLREKIFPVRHSSAFALLGFCSDEGVIRNQGRAGASLGPQAIRHHLAKMPFHRPDADFLDCGDIVCLHRNLEAAQEALTEAVERLVKAGIVPIVLGGGHEMALPHVLALPAATGIINFDAHFDLRPSRENHAGSAFYHIAKKRTPFDYTCIGLQKGSNTRDQIHLAKELNVQGVWAEDLETKGKEALSKALSRREKVYCTICLDVFAAPYAPGVSAPQPLGLSPWQIIPLVRHLAFSRQVMSYEIAELNPKYDIDHRTSRLAATLIYEIIDGEIPWTAY